MFNVLIIRIFFDKEVTSNNTNIENISDAVGKDGGVLDDIIFIFNLSFENVSCAFVKTE